MFLLLLQLLMNYLLVLELAVAEAAELAADSATEHLDQDSYYTADPVAAAVAAKANVGVKQANVKEIQRILNENGAFTGL